MYGLEAGHNAVYADPKHKLPAYSWTFAVPGALKAKSKVPPASLPNWRDLVGFPIGVAVADGTVFAPNDDGHLYAISAKSGHLLWSFDGHNEIMTTPLVLGSSTRATVVLGIGNSNFSFSQAVRFSKARTHVTRGTGFSALVGLNAASGKVRWRFSTKGEDMATPVLVDGNVVFASGGGNVRAVNPFTGKLVWKTSISSFDSMSSLDVAGSTVVLGGTNPSRLYGIDARTGKIKWSLHPAGVFSSSMGDGTPAVGSGHSVVAQIETGGARGIAISEEFMVNASTGVLMWSRPLGQGKVPPRNKDANPTIAGGTIYTASPVTSSVYSINLFNGSINWSTHLASKMKAAPTLIRGKLLVPAANGSIFCLDASSGKVVHTWHSPYGGYGPQNLVVIGETAYIGTNFGWLQAIPLNSLLK